VTRRVLLAGLVSAPLVRTAGAQTLAEPASARDCAPSAGWRRRYHGRIVFGKLGEMFGQQFVIENRSGAGGTIAERVAAKADRRPGTASARAPRKIIRRLGFARAYFRAGRSISICAGPRLHATRCAGRALHRLARPSRLRACVLVQGNAHGFDSRVLLDALDRYPKRLRGVAITDTRVAPATLRDWHRLGMRGLRFHLFSDAGRPGYVRGVGLDVFEVFRAAMCDLGWVMQVFCDWRLMGEMAARLRDISKEMPVIVDHMLNIPAARGLEDPNFQALLRLVRDGHAYVKVSAAYRLSDRFPDYPDAVPRRAAARQSGAADVGHRLAASVDSGRDHARRRAFARLVSRVDV
jgi:hypothetical protein